MHAHLDALKNKEKYLTYIFSIIYFREGKSFKQNYYQIYSFLKNIFFKCNTKVLFFNYLI